MDSDNNIEWRIHINWGTTWGHLVCGSGTNFEEVLLDTVQNAYREGCPIEWLPDLENIGIPAN